MNMQPNNDLGKPTSLASMADHVRQASEFLKALAHESRMLILYFLADGEKSVGDLEVLLGQRQSTVSQQLARLRLDGLVTTRRDGKMIYYSLADQNVRSILDALSNISVRDRLAFPKTPSEVR
jgi:DNA-binding transcriptional ArsR family regulator